MFDDLRQQANEGFDEENQDDEFLTEERPRQRIKRNFLGMTAQQRFVIVSMLVVWVCMMSFFFLFISEKIQLF